MEKVELTQGPDRQCKGQPENEKEFTGTGDWVKELKEKMKKNTADYLAAATTIIRTW